MNKTLTEARIFDLKKFLLSDIGKFFINDLDWKEYEKILIIKSKINNSMRLTIYPIRNKDIFKLIVSGSALSNYKIEQIVQLLSNYSIIHTSGLLNYEENYIFECYFELKFQNHVNLYFNKIEEKLKEIRKIIKNVKLEKIN